MALPAAVAGAVSIALIVVLGIFVFPALLQRRGGWLVCIGVTLALAALFTWFQSQQADAAPGMLLAAAVCGAIPLGVALVVRRLQGGGATADKQPR